MRSNYADNRKAQLASEKRYENEHHPFIIDAGSQFIDDNGCTHHNACGWLSVHCALHYSYFTGELPDNLVSPLLNKQIIPAKLKEMCGVSSTIKKILPDNLRTIATKLNICIVVNNCNLTDTYGNKNQFTIHLWLSSEHYGIRLTEHDYEPSIVAMVFVNQFQSLGYRARRLGTDANTDNDGAVALKLHEQMNGNTDLQALSDHEETMRELYRYV